MSPLRTWRCAVQVVDNSIDEALAGHCDAVRIVLEKDGSCTVSDNGRGIPCDIHPRTGMCCVIIRSSVLYCTIAALILSSIKVGNVI